MSHEMTYYYKLSLLWMTVTQLAWLFLHRSWHCQSLHVLESNLRKFRKVYKRTNNLTFSSHAHFEALFQTAILTLVSVVLINWAISVCPTWVCEISSYTPLEETFTPFTGELSIMFATTFVSTYHTLYLLLTRWVSIWCLRFMWLLWGLLWSMPWGMCCCLLLRGLLLLRLTPSSRCSIGLSSWCSWSSLLRRLTWTRWGCRCHRCSRLWWRLYRYWGWRWGCRWGWLW